MFFTKLLSSILVCQDVREKGMEEPPNIRKYCKDIVLLILFVIKLMNSCFLVQTAFTKTIL